MNKFRMLELEVKEYNRRSPTRSRSIGKAPRLRVNLGTLRAITSSRTLGPVYSSYLYIAFV
ncbi:MAG: hypothetical protein LC637_05925 [Xanthomonadaceae bacterium]|nr:hypothetical protein [Xanthomonadaceae bacterium]